MSLRKRHLVADLSCNASVRRRHLGEDVGVLRLAARGGVLVLARSRRWPLRRPRGEAEGQATDAVEAAMCEAPDELEAE